MVSGWVWVSKSLEIMINSVPIPLLPILLFFLLLFCMDGALAADELKQQTLQIHYLSTTTTP